MRSRKQGLVFFNSNTCKDEYLHLSVNCTSSDECQILESAHILRSASVMKSAPDLPMSLSLEDFQRGQGEPLNILVKLLKVV